MKIEQIIINYFEAFQKLDSKTMNALLAENIQFEDPAFGKLKGDEVKYMWQFLTKNAKDFSVDFKILSEKENQIEASWVAQYTFSTTGNKVINHVNSTFYVENELIVKHKDSFNLKKWAKQAFGKAAGVAGPVFILKKIVQAQSRKMLKKYMSKNTLE